ncbi:pentatricopeptide repeat-containing protein At2g27800, mitochondrial-like isoform X3 [Tripterygium wilfordii]|nr:pentatricopeptide repeat-containing protein At2g27800, mitochondrial-like isoform X3 [Tripterygium wilfordii]
MIAARKNCLSNSYSNKYFISNWCFRPPLNRSYWHFRSFSSYEHGASNLLARYSVVPCDLKLINNKLGASIHFNGTQFDPSFKIPPNACLHRYGLIPFFSLYSTKAPSRQLRRGYQGKSKSNSKPVLDEAQFQGAVSQLQPRFTNEELLSVINLQGDPVVCLELFNWASQQPRFRHDVSTYHITIRKLGTAKMYKEMDDIVNQVLAVPSVGNEALFNNIIYFFTEARKLTRAVNIFKYMKNNRKLDCRPSVRTYNILFTALLSRGSNSLINHVYMETIRSLFKQMVNDGIEPDIFSLNAMIKGYVLSLHLNDALRIFHQMGTVYSCPPNSYSYDYLIHGLCAQERTDNATALCDEMKRNGFVPSSKSYNSLVNALALNGEVDEAINFLWEMIGKRKSADFITYKTILDEICRSGRAQEAVRFLKELQEKDVVDGHTYRKLQYVLEDDFGISNGRNHFS